MKVKIVIWSLIVMLLASNVTVYGVIESDQAILSAEIDKVYHGRQEAGAILNNNQFSDVATSFWGTEAISQMAALEIVQGYRNNGVFQFRPNRNVTNEEAIAIILRSVGLEERAKTAAQNIGQQDESLGEIWSKGYMTVANQLGLINNRELADSLVAEQEILDPEFNFIRGAYVTREQMAAWLAQAINSQNPNVLNPQYENQEILRFNDWQSIDLEFAPYVEAVLKADLMQGTGNNFNPKGLLTRAELVQTIRNMGQLLYNTMNLTVKTGYIGHISQEYLLGSDNNQQAKTAWVRDNNGRVNQITMALNRDAFGKTLSEEVIVHKNGRSVGFDALREADSLVYLVDETTNKVIYIHVQGTSQITEVRGTLEAINDNGEGRLRIKVGNQEASYNVSSGLYRANREQIRIGEIFIPITEAPITQEVSLKILNQLVVSIDLVQNMNNQTELSGMVAEHNQEFNYLRIIDWDGQEVIKRYRENNIIVERQAYYNEEDEIGYIDELFPSYAFDPDDATINAIEAGDIIHVRVDPKETDYIVLARAKTNYTVKFGEIVMVGERGDAGRTLTIRTDDGMVATYDIHSLVPVIKNNTNMNIYGLEAGDQIRMLVNQAVVGLGNIVETVKEVRVDPYGNIIENLYKGQLGTINTNQETITMLNGYELQQTGWRGYSSALTLDASNKDIEYYYNGERISLGYAEHYLKQSNMDMYVVTENYYSNEKIKKITFRNGRDSVLAFDNVIASNGLNSIQLQNHMGRITLDEGTIVVKNGKHISANGIMVPDYAQVVLNGQQQAAVVIVKPDSNNSGISIMRGRIAKINEYEDFTVQSHANLRESEWIYSPIERSYTMDYRTLIKEDGKFIDFDEFKSYSEINKVDEVYTIIAEGTKATHVVKMPYAKESVLGEIYAMDNEKISLKDISVYDVKDERWSMLSHTNNYGYIELYPDTLIIKNSEVIDVEQLRIGDRLRVMTDVDMKDALTEDNLRTAPGYILMVED